jgi:hypothetical protein
MTDDLPPGLPMFIVGGNLVRPTLLLGVLLEVAAKHDRKIAESFAKRLFEDEDSAWGFVDVADALGMSVDALHAEWQRECNKRYGDKELH